MSNVTYNGKLLTICSDESSVFYATKVTFVNVPFDYLGNTFCGVDVLRPSDDDDDDFPVGGIVAISVIGGVLVIAAVIFVYRYFSRSHGDSDNGNATV